MLGSRSAVHHLIICSETAQGDVTHISTICKTVSMTRIVCISIKPLTAARVIAGGPTGARIIVKSLLCQVCPANRDHDTHEDRIRQDAVSQPSSDTVHRGSGQDGYDREADQEEIRQGRQRREL